MTSSFHTIIELFASILVHSTATMCTIFHHNFFDIPSTSLHIVFINIRHLHAPPLNLCFINTRPLDIITRSLTNSIYIIPYRTIQLYHVIIVSSPSGRYIQRFFLPSLSEHYHTWIFLPKCRCIVEVSVSLTRK